MSVGVNHRCCCSCMWWFAC